MEVHKTLYLTPNDTNYLIPKMYETRKGTKLREPILLFFPFFKLSYFVSFFFIIIIIFFFGGGGDGRGHLCVFFCKGGGLGRVRMYIISSETPHL